MPMLIRVMRETPTEMMPWRRLRVPCSVLKATCAVGPAQLTLLQMKNMEERKGIQDMRSIFARWAAISYVSIVSVIQPHDHSLRKPCRLQIPVLSRRSRARIPERENPRGTPAAGKTHDASWLGSRP